MASESPKERAEKCVVIIPCFNEANAIGGLVVESRRHVPEVIVVDDGSTDLTGENAERAGATVLCHKQRFGKGAALRTGWHYAFRGGSAWAFCLDGDGQHDPAEIPAFLEQAQRTSAALVIGNRMADSSGMPIARRWVNRWMSRRLSGLSGQALPDSQCGFRLMNLQAWSGLSVSSRHFEIESEVLLSFLRARHRVEFVPIRTIYNQERSKIRPVQDTFRWFRWWRTACRPQSREIAKESGEGYSRRVMMGDSSNKPGQSIPSPTADVST